MKIKLNQLNYLIGHIDLKKAVGELYIENENVFSVLTILIAVRKSQNKKAIRNLKIVSVNSYLETPELINPRRLRWVCSTSQRFENYSLGPSGVVYYGFNYKNGQYKYVPLGLGIRWYRTSGGKFVIYNRGLVTNTIENITFC
ncbi:MAG: hypothetical protein HN431_12520 [Bacteroidetes bacterium]|nr:hypothetical protein [Bacteroidota bacterium]